MSKFVKKLGFGVGLVFVGAATLLAFQESSPTTAGNPSANTAAPASDHAEAYYHFMLARRYKELAGVYNRADYVRPGNCRV